MEIKSFNGFGQNMMKEYKIFLAYRQDSSETSGTNFHISTKYKSNARSISKLTNSSDNRQSCSHSTETCLDVYKMILKNLKEGRENMSEVKRLILKRKKHTFGSSDQLDNKIETLMSKCRNLMSDTETHISEALNLHSINSSQRLKTLIANMKCSLSGKISQSAKELREIERVYAKLKNLTVTDDNNDKSEFDFINKLSTNENTQVLYDDLGNSLIMSEIEESEASAELRSIFRNIDSMSKLLKDMSVLAVTQGTLIDRIDINIGNTLETAQRTNIELLASKEMLKNDLTSKCTKWLILLNILVFVLLLIKHML